MASEERAGSIVEAVEQLNTALGSRTPYRLVAISPKEVVLLDRNPHYMSKKMFDQLTANIRKDGNLGSLPLLWKRPDGLFECLSGNHRVQAAAAAEIDLILCLYTDAELSKSEKTAIAMSHNSIFGKDDPVLLKELWLEIDDLSAKVYSGIDEEYLATLPQPTPIQIKDQDLNLEVVTIYFIPAEVERMKEIIEKLSATEKPRLGASYEIWDRFFEDLLKFKEAKNIMNTSVAIHAMLDLVEAHLAPPEPGDGE